MNSQNASTETMSIFSPKVAARFDALVEKYPLRRSALVPMLLYAQDEIGYLSDAVIAEVAAPDRDHRTRCAQRSHLLLDAAVQACGQVQRAGLHEYQLHAARRVRGV